MMRAIFLDRDGVISENRDDHVKSWDEFHFIPGALDALRWLNEANIPTFIVTNQAIINRGTIQKHTIDLIHARMLQDIVAHGGFISDIRYCPHDSHENCNCRKPRPGMLNFLAKRWNIDLARSYMVGDAWTDIAAGRAVNCRTVLVRTGRGGMQCLLPEGTHPPADYIAADLAQAVEWVFSREGIAKPVFASGSQPAHPASASQGAALAVGG